MGLFKRKSEKEKLLDQYKKLKEKAYKLSHSDRMASDKVTAEAEALMDKIEQMD